MCQQVVDGDLDRAHVHAAGEPQICIKQIAVAVFLRGPAAQPNRPRRVTRPRQILSENVE